jgi:hypothetical protein
MTMPKTLYDVSAALLNEFKMLRGPDFGSYEWTTEEWISQIEEIDSDPSVPWDVKMRIRVLVGRAEELIERENE